MKRNTSNHNYYETLNHEYLKSILFNKLSKYFDDLRLRDEQQAYNEEIVKELTQIHIDSLIETEFKMFIEQRTLNGDKSVGKGIRIKSLDTKHGTLRFKVKRIENGIFTPQCLGTTRRTETITNAFLYLSQLNLKFKMVSDIINNLYGVKYSADFCSKLSVLNDDYVEEFNNRQLDDYYPVIYIDATYIPIRYKTNSINQVERQALTIALGINKYGFKEILGYNFGNKETKHKWELLLDDLKIRGVKKVDVVVSDGLVGGEEAIYSRFTDVKHQKCMRHIKANIMDAVRKEDREFTDKQMKLIMLSNTIDEFEERKKQMLMQFTQEPDVYKYIDQKLSGDCLTYLEFPDAMRTTIQTSNALEGVNNFLKRESKSKQTFPNIQSAKRNFTSSMIRYNSTIKSISRGLKEYLGL